MSVRYTGEATMDEPALRDVERWKDKIEVRLDNRQVFFLFFGSAMVACMLFVLGVIVGKRLETRGHAEAPAVDDPLAVLDRFGVAASPPATAPVALTFPSALIGGGMGDRAKGTPALADRTGKPPRLDRVAVKTTFTSTVPVAAAPTAAPAGTPAVAAGPVVAAATRPAAASPESPTTSSKLAALPRLVATPATSPRAAALATPSRAAALATPSRAAALAPLAKAPALATPAKAAALAPPPRTAAIVSAKEPTQPAKTGAVGPSRSGVAPVEKGKGRFLLQLSSFQDRAEAEAFARRFAAQNAYVVATEIPGKGTLHRVRVGNYGSLQEASLAKTSFEHEHNVIAYVAGNGPAK